MTTSVLEQYRISDFLEWSEKKQLHLNPDFQRGLVWTTPAKVFLIDTILRKLPMPKIYMRTKVDLKTRRSYREIVDGQQRLKAIVEFAADELVLTDRAKEYAGLKYTTLGEELQEQFLSYAISVEQLINASDDDVLEVFARLNTYTVTLNEAERRHARYQGAFRWAVHEASARWSILWDRFQVISVRQRLRMLDDSLMAEMFGVLLEGVRDGGQPKITKLYDKYDKEFPDQKKTIKAADETLKFVETTFGDLLTGSTLARAPHFLLLFAAVAHALHGIPVGELGELPARDPEVLKNIGIARDNLSLLSKAIEGDDTPTHLRSFWLASISSTQRIGSRKARFPLFYAALLPKAL